MPSLRANAEQDRSLAAGRWAAADLLDEPLGEELAGKLAHRCSRQAGDARELCATDGVAVVDRA